jgi:antitoxin (DNA-binding transcriptional repressor) of toxin-antitoxin stability system
MRQVNIHEAKTTLSKLIEAAEAGEKILIARAGKPVDQLVRLPKNRGIILGGLKGKIPRELMDDVAKPLSEAQINALKTKSSSPGLAKGLV